VPQEHAALPAAPGVAPVRERGLRAGAAHRLHRQRTHTPREKALPAETPGFAMDYFLN